MKLKTTGIDHVNLQVTDLEESCQFWADLLDFKILEDFPEEKGRIIGNKEAKLALYEVPNFVRHNGVGFRHVSFHIANFEHIERKCSELGIEIKFSGSIQWPKSRSIYINDPNGYEIEFSEVWGGELV